VPASRRNPRWSRLGPVEDRVDRVGSVRSKGRADSLTLEITAMTVVTHELKASYAFIERNFNLTRRYWGW